MRRLADDRAEEVDANHLDDVDDGCGCTEIWGSCRTSVTASPRGSGSILSHTGVYSVGRLDANRRDVFPRSRRSGDR